jgi:hypothetical protein
VASAIHRGLTMSTEDKQSRQSALYKIVTTYTSYSWAAMLVKKLLLQVGAENTAHNTPVLDRPAMGSMYEKAKKRLMLFDYDVCLPSHSLSILRTHRHVGYFDTHCKDPQCSCALQGHPPRS